MGRKKLFETKEELEEHKKKWFAAYKKRLPEEKRHEYNRKAELNRCLERVSFPTLNTIKLYKYRKEEIQPIFDSLLLFIEEQLTDVSDTTDTLDSE